MWEILGIEPTTNEKDITKAYRLKLLKTNPEEKPEEFKALRKAYEDAIQYARGQYSEQKDSPIEAWVQQLDVLYHNFKNRMNVSCWKELLSQDICKAIDTKQIIEEKMLQYFYNNYYLSHDVWVYLDSQFDFMNRLEELYEKHPENFINYVVRDGIIYPDLIKAEYYQPGEDGEELQQYLNIYNRILNAAGTQKKELFKELNQLHEYHPYGELAYLQYQIDEENIDTLDKIKSLYETYSEDKKIKMGYASACLNHGDAMITIELCKQLLEDDDENTDYKWILANAYAKVENYRSAIDEAHEIIAIIKVDEAKLQIIDDTRFKWNESFIEQLLQKEPDNQIYVDLCWAYLQNRRNEECIEISKKIKKEETDPFDYHNLMSFVCLEKKDYEQFNQHIDALVDVIKHLEDDGTKKTKRRKDRLAEIYSRKAGVALDNKQYDEGIKILLESLTLDENSADVISTLVRVYLHICDYDNTYTYARRLIDLMPSGYNGYLYLSYALFHLGYDREAFEAINESMSLYSYDLRSYILKARILIRNQAYDGAKELLKVLENQELDSDINYVFCKALLALYEDNDEEKAEELFKQVYDQIDEHEELDYRAEVCLRYLELKGQHLNGNVKEDRDIMFTICDKGLSFDPNYAQLLDYKAWLLVKDEKWEEALVLYKRLEQFATHPVSVEKQIGYIYYQDLKNDADKSLEYQLKALERDKDPEIIFKAGMCEMYMGDYENSLKHFEMLKEFEWNIDYEYRSSMVQADMRQYEEALVHALKAVDIIQERENDCTKFYRNAVMIYSRMDRFEEAINFINKYKENPNYKHYLTDLYNAYSQAGKYDELLKEMKTWHKKGLSKIEVAHHKIETYLSSGDIKKAENELTKTRFLIDNDASSWTYEYRLDMANMKYKSARNVIQRMIQNKEANGNKDLSNDYLHMSFVCALLGKKEDQLDYAKKAIKLTKKDLEARFSCYKAVYYTRIAKAYALLEDYDTCDHYLALARKITPCENCLYSSCKDADLYDVDIYILKGEYEKAYEKMLENIEKWKDDMDNYVHMKLLKKKVKK